MFTGAASIRDSAACEQDDSMQRQLGQRLDCHYSPGMPLRPSPPITLRANTELQRQ